MPLLLPSHFIKHLILFNIVILFQERLQFYIVVYDSYQPEGNLMGRFAVDRFLIDLTLGPVPAVVPRQTYHGIYNISQFDLSFSVACTDSNHSGPDCCSEVGEVFTCDAMGNRGCTNPSCDLDTDCQECTTTPTAGALTSSPSTALPTLNTVGTSTPPNTGGTVASIGKTQICLAMITITPYTKHCRYFHCT